ncbi:B12-binding domain-containing radical SAM protein [Elusimicrobiota bacterium]
MRIALIFLELENTVHKRYQLQLRVPFGLLYLKSSLIKHSHIVQILDERLLLFSMRSLVKKIRTHRYDVVGFHVNSVNLQKTLMYIKNIRKAFPDLTIIAGGPGAIHYCELLESGCSVVCHGEGEDRFPEILKRISGKLTFSGIDGISYYENSKIKHSVPYTQTDLDTLEMPYWDRHLILSYGDNYIPTLKRPTATVIASRGCTFNCSFCTTPGMSPAKRYRMRKVPHVIDEICLLKEKYGVRYITFMDDLFGAQKDWIHDFCNALIKEKMRINWFCLLHPMSFKYDREGVFGLMRRSGCDCVAFGVQSNNSQILQNIKRHPSEPQELAKGLAVCRSLGIRTTATYILGLPGETHNTINDNLNFSLRHMPDFADFHELVPLPGSELVIKGTDNPTRLSNREVLSYCRKSMFRFYSNPRVIANLLTRIIFNNYNFTRHLLNVLKAHIAEVINPFSVTTEN